MGMAGGGDGTGLRVLGFEGDEGFAQVVAGGEDGGAGRVGEGLGG